MEAHFHFIPPTHRKSNGLPFMWSGWTIELYKNSQIGHKFHILVICDIQKEQYTLLYMMIWGHIFFSFPPPPPPPPPKNLMVCPLSEVDYEIDKSAIKFLFSLSATFRRRITNNCLSTMRSNAAFNGFENMTNYCSPNLKALSATRNVLLNVLLLKGLFMVQSLQILSKLIKF